MFIPASSSFPMFSSSQHLGPIVQTILVLRFGASGLMISWYEMALHRIDVVSSPECPELYTSPLDDTIDPSSFPGAASSVIRGLTSAQQSSTPRRVMHMAPGGQISLATASLRRCAMTAVKSFLVAGAESILCGMREKAELQCLTTSSDVVTTMVGTDGRYLDISRGASPVCVKQMMSPAVMSTAFLAAQQSTASSVPMGFGVKSRRKRPTW
mmetsp:Transcript_24165/g.60757  ORF Transcript_24165/g.60757 Transcript_24165/m.60757 type:complete len:212 (-) Transcript_24165:49-684(-)